MSIPNSSNALLKIKPVERNREFLLHFNGFPERNRCLFLPCELPVFGPSAYTLYLPEQVGMGSRSFKYDPVAVDPVYQ